MERSKKNKEFQEEEARTLELLFQHIEDSGKVIFVRDWYGNVLGIDESLK